MKALTPNLMLKVAIVQSGKNQRAIAKKTRIPETRLSHIVRGRLEATSDERALLAKALRRAESDLFPLAQQEQAS